MSKIRVRFAPSPTGPLHLGGVRTALYNYLFAKSQGGDFILRIEDTDTARYVEGAEDYIMEALDWLGIQPVESPKKGGPYAPYRQSERRDIYDKYTEQILKTDYAYLAFDTPEELDKIRLEYEAKGEVFSYNNITRNSLRNSIALPKDEVEKLLAEKVPFVVRFKMPENRVMELSDIIRGNFSVNTDTLDDKVLVKQDGMPTYHFANIIDDHEMQITNVIRGEEWLPSMALHVLLYEAMGWKAPEFAHLPLILKPEGKGKHSKRDGDKFGFPVFPLNFTDKETKAVYTVKTNDKGAFEGSLMKDLYNYDVAVYTKERAKIADYKLLDSLGNEVKAKRKTKELEKKPDPQKDIPAIPQETQENKKSNKEIVKEITGDKVKTESLPNTSVNSIMYLSGLVSLISFAMLFRRRKYNK